MQTISGSSGDPAKEGMNLGRVNKPRFRIGKYVFCVTAKPCQKLGVIFADVDMQARGLLTRPIWLSSAMDGGEQGYG
jgi:hypothetical protein